MNAKNSDFGYHALHQLFYNSYLCANAGFEKKSTIKNGLNRIYKIVQGRNEKIDNVKTTAAVKMFFQISFVVML